MWKQYKRKSINLVLSGGGARGMAHIGAIWELEKHGYKIASITGTSIGAIVGAMYSMNKLKEFYDWMSSLQENELTELLDISIKDNFQIKGDKLFGFLYKIADDRPIEELDTSLKIIATDMISGEAVCFDKGSLFKALRASISIPAILAPVKTGTGILSDGGVVDPYPLDFTSEKSKNILVGINLYAYPIRLTNDKDIDVNEGFWNYIKSKLDLMKDWKIKIIHYVFSDSNINMGYLKTLRRTTDLMNVKMAEQASKIYKPNFEINIPLTSAGLFDFHRTKELKTLGERIARESIQRYELSQTFTAKMTKWLSKFTTGK